MKEITRTKTEVVGYESTDGTYFDTKDECQRYEQSALCVVRGRIKEIALKSTTEYGLFEMGSVDCDLFVVIPKSKEDINLLNQLAILINGDDQRQVTDGAIGKTVFVYTGYNNDSCWFDTLESLVRRITDGKYTVVEKKAE